MAAVVVPAVCEPALKNQPEASRLAVIIDQLVALNGGAAAGQSQGIAAGAPFTSADASGADAAVTLAPTAGQFLVLDSLYISSTAAINLTFKEETSGAVVLGPIYFPANGTVQLTGLSRKLAVADKRLMVRASGAGAISVLAKYHSEA